jgi:hypothetical protein
MVISPFLGTACAFTGHVVLRQQEEWREVPKSNERDDQVRPGQYGCQRGLLDFALAEAI